MNEAFSNDRAVVKEAILKKYAERDPKRFCQIDLWAEGIFEIGDDGPSITNGSTIELMHGSEVRVLIRPDLDPMMAARLLRLAGDSIEQDPDQIDTWRGIHDLKPTAEGVATEEPEANDGERQAMSRHLSRRTTPRPSAAFARCWPKRT